MLDLLGFCDFKMRLSRRTSREPLKPRRGKSVEFDRDLFKVGCRPGHFVRLVWRLGAFASVTLFCRPLRNHSATWPHGAGSIYCINYLGNRLRHLRLLILKSKTALILK